MADAFAQEQAGLDSPAASAAVVTPSDSTPLATDSRSLYVGTGGNLTIVTSGGSTVPLVNLPSGSWVPFRVHQVMATGTTASNIVAMW